MTEKDHSENLDLNSLLEDLREKFSRNIKVWTSELYNYDVNVLTAPTDIHVYIYAYYNCYGVREYDNFGGHLWEL